jgi:polyisoprenyl-phosphate glycosyltransferase
LKKLAIVVPCYNEEESLPHLIKSLEKIRGKLKSHQLDYMLVNDGSRDNTQQIIDDLSKKNQHVYFIEFSRNSGHQSALRAGLNAVKSYDAAIMMDADVQHPPELIPKMIEAWEDGNKIVQMVRNDNAKQVGAVKYMVRTSYYRFINFMSDLSLEYGASDFRLIDKTVTKQVAKSPEQDLFLRGYFSWLPVSRTVIEYVPNQRIAGVSKYNLRKLLDLAYKGILQFSEKPLKISVIIGSVVALLSFLYGLFLIIQNIFGTSTVSGWASLMVVMLFCFGVNFILVGFIGSYLAHAISIQKQRPDFIIAAAKLPDLRKDRKLQ